ncbi:MAG TPA: hypothetical protein VFT27_04590 [Actinomycetota bacterium]|nr:hypothetical protein [Actinomycetota bacterium]
MATKRAIKASVIVGVLVLAVLWGGLALNVIAESSERVYLAGALIATAVISFIGFLLIGNYLSDRTALEASQMRTAIAGTFVVTYFAILGLFVFSTYTPTDFASRITNDLLGQVALVVGFYFATSGALEFARIRERGREQARGPSPDDREEPSHPHELVNVAEPQETPEPRPSVRK